MAPTRKTSHDPRSSTAQVVIDTDQLNLASYRERRVSVHGTFARRTALGTAGRLEQAGRSDRPFRKLVDVRGLVLPDRRRLRTLPWPAFSQVSSDLRVAQLSHRPNHDGPARRRAGGRAGRGHRVAVACPARLPRIVGAGHYYPAVDGGPQ